MLAVVILWQLWRSLTLEERLRRSESERAVLLGMRILRAAASSADVMSQLPSDQRFVLRGDRLVVGDDIAWLEQAARVDDIVFDDRLERAARAEFVGGDHDLAAREFDELLDGRLLASQRLQVLAAATWQAKRAEDGDRLASLRASLSKALAEVSANELAKEEIAAVVASAARLGSGDETLAALLPFLPPVPFAALEVDDDTATRHAAIRDRRARAQTAQRCCERLGTAPASGLHVAGDWVLWILPEVDGERAAAVVSPQTWFDAVVAAGREGKLLEWPERIAPDFVAVEVGAVAGVPGIGELRGAHRVADQAWLLPALTLLLIGGFALAVTQQIRASRREADAVAAQAQFLTTVTHELKTPLAGIRLLGEMLAEGRANGRESEYYRLLVGESARLSMLIENVLDLGRLERGERDYVLRPEPVADLVRETLAMFAPVAEQDGVEVAFDDRLDGSLARIDRAAFVQALIAVLDNARKYGRDGKRIDLQGIVHDGTLVLRVRDYGPGVPEQEHERIFERFVRGEADAHGSTPGVGIGLYLARVIARKLGGELRCERPEEGNGAEFRFTLQREAA